MANSVANLLDLIFNVTNDFHFQHSAKKKRPRSMFPRQVCSHPNLLALFASIGLDPLLLSLLPAFPLPPPSPSSFPSTFLLSPFYPFPPPPSLSLVPLHPPPHPLPGHHSLGPTKVQTCPTGAWLITFHFCMYHGAVLPPFPLHAHYMHITCTLLAVICLRSPGQPFPVLLSFQTPTLTKL